MIDVRDLQVGSYVLDVHGRLIQIRDIDGCGIAKGYTILGEKSVCDTDQLQPIRLTYKWLDDFRFTSVPLIRNRTEYSIAEAKIWVRQNDSGQFTLTFSAGVDRPMSFVHELQAIFWNLERVWLALPQS